MAIRRYEPLGLINELTRELSRLSEGGDDASSLATSDWTPAVDIREEPNRYVIEADLPGVRPEDIDIHMEGGLLTISGSRQSEVNESAEGYKRVERVAGSFYRRFSLPDTADAERISARSDHGVLQVVIPKQEKTRPRRIQVEG
ncbi:Hsp20/alpha crystallin family protein [Arhodomonas sp. AD133]|uniref:Hsp20/alpha crystallin family protein n=1 Tax=Arhodomonas sp. AD133 TaxID=3415009 RepID=UPI003EB6E7A7